MTNRARAISGALLRLSAAFAVPAVGAAEETTIKVMAPWEGVGRVYRVGPE